MTWPRQPDPWPSEADEAQEAAQAWTNKMANRAYDLADEIAMGLDKHAWDWRPDQLLDVEEIHYELLTLRNRMVKQGLIDPSKAVAE